jgi:MFS family permease
LRGRPDDRAPDDRTRAIGAWAGPGAVAGAIGPTVGGYLTDAVSWRAVFLINLPPGVFVLVAAVVHVPETRDPTRAGGLDLRDAALATLAIAGVCFALIEASAQLKTWRILRKLRCCPWRAGKLAKAIHVLQLREA